MFDIIYLSETYFDSSILPQDSSLEMQEYTLIRAGHQSHVKRERVCIYYKSTHVIYFPLILFKRSYLPECITFELSIKYKLFIIAAHCETPIQWHSEFTNLLENTVNLENHITGYSFKKYILKSCFR